jgi:hypothetical protein
MERRKKRAGRAYMIGPQWSVEQEFSIEYCVPHWECLVAVMQEENPLLLEVVHAHTVYLQTETTPL